jgi:hypothetical protein
MSKDELHQDKKGFDFLKKLTAATDEPHLLLSVKPQSKLTETQQVQLAILPGSCVFNKRLLSFLSAFRLYCFKKLSKCA